MRGIWRAARQFHRNQNRPSAPRLDPDLCGPRALQPLQLHYVNRRRVNRGYLGHPFPTRHFLIHEAQQADLKL